MYKGVMSKCIFVIEVKIAFKCKKYYSLNYSLLKAYILLGSAHF